MDSQVKNKAKELIQAKCPVQNIQRIIADEYNHFSSRPDLHNLARQLKKGDENTLTAAVKLLEETHGTCAIFLLLFPKLHSSNVRSINY